MKDGLAGAPAYTLIFLIWIAVAVAFAIVGDRAGKALGIPNDGCLQGFANVVLTLIGGGLGLLLAPYPVFILTSLLTATLLPALATAFFVHKNRKR